MRCLACRNPDTAVINSRPTADAGPRRCRKCMACGFRFTNLEVEAPTVATSGNGLRSHSVERGRRITEALTGLSDEDFDAVLHLVRRLGGEPVEKDVAV